MMDYRPVIARGQGRGKERATEGNCLGVGQYRILIAVAVVRIYMHDEML
jgi:hypothetical protein